MADTVKRRIEQMRLNLRHSISTVLRQRSIEDTDGGLADELSRNGLTVIALELEPLFDELLSLRATVARDEVAESPEPMPITSADRSLRDGQGLRLVPEPVQVDGLDTDQLAALYRRVMGGAIDFTKHETFVVRLWDGMDGCWTDCTGTIGRHAALGVWAERTDGGTRHVSYGEIDYYAIFPGGTHMHWDGSEGKEMHR